jgi:hypothetical protein
LFMTSHTLYTLCYYLPGLTVAPECPYKVIGSLLRERRHPGIHYQTAAEVIAEQGQLRKGFIYARTICSNFVAGIGQHQFSVK